MKNPQGTPSKTKRSGRGGGKNTAARKTRVAPGGRARPRKNGRPNAAADVEALFPALTGEKHRFGVGVVLAVAERQGGDADIQSLRIQSFFTRPGQRPKSSLLGRVNPGDLAQLLTGLAHPDRIRIAQAVMKGANSHQLLSEAVGLKTGPLYHHVRELERAGILATVSRNAYVLTEVGRLTLYVATGLGLILDKKKPHWRSRRVRTSGTARRKK